LFVCPILSIYSEFCFSFQGEPTDDKEDSGSEIICLDSNGTEEEVEEEESKHSSLDDQDTGSEGVNRKELESSLEEEGEEEEDSGKSNSPDEDVEAMYQPGASITVRKRFAPSSSSSSSYSNDGNSSNEGLDFSLRAKMEKSVVRGYSQVEPDLVSDHEAEETDQIAQPVEEVENPQEEEDEEVKEPNYSQVEEDLELNEEDEPESLDAVERVEVRGHLIAVTDSSPVDDFDLSNEEEEMEDEEEIQENVEDEDFELKFSDTPCSAVNVATRRSSVRRSRFRMSIAASPGQEEEEVDENEEREVRGPELSQYDLGEEEEESSAEEEDEQPEVTRRVSSHPSSHKVLIVEFSFSLWYFLSNTCRIYSQSSSSQTVNLPAQQRTVISKKSPRNLWQTEVPQWKVPMSLLKKITSNILNQLHLRYLFRLTMKLFFRFHISLSYRLGSSLRIASLLVLKKNKKKMSNPKKKI